MVLNVAYDLRELIKTEAKSLGFSNIGFCNAEEDYRFDRFEKWVQNGNAGAMEYLYRNDTLEKRRDLSALFPDAKTLISFAFSYLPNPPASEPSNHPEISSYAWGIDYHLIIPDLLKLLASRIEDFLPEGNFLYKIYCDSSPLLERAIAHKAGLGWIGKNSCVIHPKLGSYFFLAEMAINVELPADEPFETDYCGSCSRCIQNCPTHCILPDRTINASHCISYLTIENRQEIPLELRNEIGNWVFGCDVCQQVCPWNHKGSVGILHPDLHPQSLIEEFDPSTLLFINEEQFKSAFQRSPLLRTKLRGIKRNILNFIGNSRDSRFEKVLIAFLQEENDPLLLEHGTWAIHRIQEFNSP